MSSSGWVAVELSVEEARDATDSLPEILPAEPTSGDGEALFWPTPSSSEPVDSSAGGEGGLRARARKLVIIILILTLILAYFVVVIMLLIIIIVEHHYCLWCYYQY